MKKLLVIRFGALGDLIHVSPSLTYIKQQQPDLEIHFLTSPAYHELAGTLESVARVWTYDKRRPWRNLFALARELKACGIDGVVNLHPSFKTWLLSTLLGAPVAVYHKEKLSEKGQNQRKRTRRHAIEDFYQPFSKLLDLPTPTALLPKLPMEELSPSWQKPAGQCWLGLIPGVGNKRSNRAWDVASYRTLIESLLEQQPNLRILLIGGPDEKALADALQLSDRVENHCGRHAILETAALLAQCDLVIGGDTGPTHLAAATGVPVVSVFGPTAITRTGPRGAGVITDLTPPEQLTCWPCELAECPLTGDEHLACMKMVPVDTVLSAVNAQLRESVQQKTSC